MAQQSLRVLVIDKNSGEKIPFAYVNTYQYPGNAMLNTVLTDENGVAEIIPNKYPFKLEVVAFGYEPITQQVYSGTNQNLSFYLIKKYATVDEVVVTGLTAPKSRLDALSSYQVITKGTIQAQGAVTLNDVLKNQLNMRVNNDNILGANIQMQGVAGDKVKILIDGIPVNGREGGNVSLNQINLNNIERIEIVQGPMSVVYGTDALGGVINLITKKEKKPYGINASVYYESYGRYNFDISGTYRLANRHQFTLGGGRNFFQGWKYLDTPKKSSDGEHELLLKRNLLFKPNEQYFGNFAYNYTAPSGFSLDVASDYMKEHVLNQGSLSVWDAYLGAYAYDEEYNTQRSQNRLAMKGKLGKSGTWLSQNGYSLYHRTRYSYKKDLVTLQETVSNAFGGQDTSTFQDVYMRGSYNNKLWKIDYTVGYDVNLQFARSLKVDSGITKQIQDYALYTQLSMPIVKDKLTVQGGLRGTYNTVYDPPLIPSFSLLYKPVKKLQLRGSYAKGFRAPSLKERYLSFIDIYHHIIGNENLAAEESQHIQASASYQVFQKKGDYLQLMLTGYLNDVTNGIALVPIYPNNPNSIDYTYGNVTKQENTIASLQAEGQLGNFHYQLGYSYTHTFAQEDAYDAFSAQEATATLQYGWKKIGMNFNAFYKYYGSQPFMTIGIDGKAYFSGKQNPYQICDMSVEKSLWKQRVQLIAGVKNVFGVQRITRTGGISSSGSAHSGGDTGGVNLLPRSFFTSLRFSLN